MDSPRRCLCGCGMELPSGPKAGKPQKFLDREHKKRFEKAARQVGAVTLERRTKSPRRRPFDNRAAQYIVLTRIPAAERPALLAQAAENLGLIETPVLKAARMVRRICDRAIAAGQDPRACFRPLKDLRRHAAQPFEICGPGRPQDAIERQLKLEAMVGVLEASVSRAARESAVLVGMQG